MFAWLKAIPEIVEIISTILRLVQTEQAKQQGRDEAVAKGLAKANADLVYANEIDASTAAAHNAHPNDDSAFDPDFQRKD